MKTLVSLRWSWSQTRNAMKSILKEDKFLLWSPPYWNGCCVHWPHGDEQPMWFISLVNGSNTHKKRRKHEYVPVRKERFFAKLEVVLKVIYIYLYWSSVLLQNWSLTWRAGLLVDQFKIICRPIWLIREFSRNVSWHASFRNKQFTVVNKISASPLR